MAGVGAGSLLLNAIAYSAAGSSTNNYGGSSSDDSTKSLAVGGMVIGVVAALIGVIMLATSGTTVKVE